ncbi:MAG: tetratricopeptide repeat protein [Planctomycetes bacterium]|nr:tetratricopeptide repeat protein [Planctomycetota bacterium]
MPLKTLALLIVAPLALAGSFAFAAQPAAEVRPAVSKELDALLKKPEAEIDLATGALLLCKEEHAALDVAAQLKLLDALAAKLAPALAKAGTAEAKLDALKSLLFEDEKFGLPRKDDAAAFLLADVLANKRGNCLGLSVLCLALAERTGLPLHGVPVPSRLSGPGHLLVRYDDGVARRNFDATEGGALHDDAYYRDLFKLKPDDFKSRYILGNAQKLDVLNLLLVNLGGARVEAGRFRDAVPLLERAVELKPSYAPAFNNLGAAKFGDKSGASDLDGALRAYAQAVKLDPNFAAAHAGLAAAAFRLGQLEKAEEEAMTTEALEPGNVQAKIVLANIHLERGEKKAACAMLEEACRAAPKDARLRCHLGDARLASAELPEAESAYREALTLDPNAADAAFGLAEALRLAGQAEKAKGAYGDALRLDPGHIPTRLALALLAKQSGDLKGAAAGYEAVLKDHPAEAGALKGLAEILTAQGRAQEAEKRLAEALKANPADAALAVACADAKMKADPAAALAILQPVLEKAPESARAPILQRIAICHGRLGNHRKALDNAEALLKTDPKDLPALHVAAAASEALRDGPRALNYYNRIIVVDPADQTARKAIARLNAR